MNAPTRRPLAALIASLALLCLLTLGGATPGVSAAALDADNNAGGPIIVSNATLRATILAQIAAIEERCAADPSATGPCIVSFWDGRKLEQELVSYVNWRMIPAICGESRAFPAIGRSYTTAELRDQEMLDLYLANLWCKTGRA